MLKMITIFYFRHLEETRQGSRRGSRLKDGRGRIVKFNNISVKTTFKLAAEIIEWSNYDNNITVTIYLQIIWN